MAASTLRPASPATRTAILASADLSFRQRVRDALTALRWQVREASGGAEALAYLDSAPAETLILDSWLPDLEIQEFVSEFQRLHPGIDLVTVDPCPARRETIRSPRRNEVLFAVRRGQDTAGSSAASEAGSIAGSKAGSSATSASESLSSAAAAPAPTEPTPAEPTAGIPASHREPGLLPVSPAAGHTADHASPIVATPQPRAASCRLPEFIGDHPSMLRVSQRVRLVAPHPTPVLVEGPTGTGKELVARALHRLSPRSSPLPPSPTTETAASATFRPPPVRRFRPTCPAIRSSPPAPTSSAPSTTSSLTLPPARPPPPPPPISPPSIPRSTMSASSASLWTIPSPGSPPPATTTPPNPRSSSPRRTPCCRPTPRRSPPSSARLKPSRLPSPRSSRPSTSRAPSSISCSNPFNAATSSLSSPGPCCYFSALPASNV